MVFPKSPPPFTWPLSPTTHGGKVEMSPVCKNCWAQPPQARTGSKQKCSQTAPFRAESPTLLQLGGLLINLWDLALIGVRGKGKVSSQSALLYLRIQWNQIAQMDRKRKNDHLSKMEPLSIHSHETSLQLKLLAKKGLGQIKRQIYFQMTYKGSTTKYLLSKYWLQIF